MTSPLAFLMMSLGLPYHSEASSSGGQQARCLSEVLKHGDGTRGFPAPEIPPCGLSSLPHWFFLTFKTLFQVIHLKVSKEYS